MANRAVTLAIAAFATTAILSCSGAGSTPGDGAPADPPERPSAFVARNDLEVVPEPGGGGRAEVLLRWVQLSDIHITDETFNFFSSGLEGLIDDFGDAIGFGGFQRSATQEQNDVDVLSAFVATIDAMNPPPDFVLCTGDLIDTGLRNEAVTARDRLNGLAVPWLVTAGNHDDLVLGNVPPDIADEVFSGDFLALDDFVPLFFGDGHGPSERIAAGHGFALNPRFDGTDPRTSRGYYAFDAAPAGDGNPGVRFVILETTEEGGGANGAIGAEQLDWLTEDLDAHADELVVVASHHQLADIDNPLGPHHGNEIARVLLAHPNVVAHVSGHTHINHVGARRGSSPGRGFWEVQTSALIDSPEEGRVFELSSNGDGTGTITSYVFHQRAHGALGDKATDSLVASQADPFDGSGTDTDRHVALTVPLAP